MIVLDSIRILSELSSSFVEARCASMQIQLISSVPTILSLSQCMLEFLSLSTTGQYYGLEPVSIFDHRYTEACYSSSGRFCTFSRNPGFILSKQGQ